MTIVTGSKNSIGNQLLHIQDHLLLCILISTPVVIIDRLYDPDQFQLILIIELITPKYRSLSIDIDHDQLQLSNHSGS